MTFQLVTTPCAPRCRCPRRAPVAWTRDCSIRRCARRASPIRARACSNPSALVVTTGQQPGLFTGPLYTIYKAISVAALARRLEAEWQRPVVPVFWLATDDHDFAEANRAAWPAPDGSIRHVTLRERAADAVMAPMYREPLGTDILTALADAQGRPAGRRLRRRDDGLAGATLSPGVHGGWCLCWRARGTGGPARRGLHGCGMLFTQAARGAGHDARAGTGRETIEAPLIPLAAQLANAG